MKDKRCIHLDFHTSERIEGVGSLFNAEEFKNNLIRAGVDSITLFAKCHHGCFYYEDTQFFKHPHLCGSLLDKQVQACKEIGVSAKIYISAGLDEYIARQHPEWIVENKDGLKPYDTGFRRICFNSPYLDILVKQTEEVVKKYMPDGVFFDIVGEVACCCKNCRADMKKKGLSVENPVDIMKQARDVFGIYVKTINDTVRAIKPDCLIFHNAGDFPVGRQDRLDSCDQLETESLPTSIWGYDHFPLSMAYIRRKGKNCIGMTGKFHRGWGEYGAFKYKTALKYEASQCLALDAGFCVGDQLHPLGAMDAYTYENVGEANAYIKEREHWRGGEYLAEMAIYSPKGGNGRKGISRILFEEKILFDMIDENEISNRYKVIILCDDLALTESERSTLKNYIKNGGKILAMGQNATLDGKMAFDLGCTYKGEDKQIPCYIQAHYPLKYANSMIFVAYEKAYSIEPTGCVLAKKLSPYFVREGTRFCSHLHTPYDPEKISTAITEGTDGIYIASDLFSQYAKDGSLTAKQLIVPLIDKLLKERTIITDLPSSGKVALYKKNKKIVCHLWYANTIKRGDGIEIIEDIVTLSKVKVSIKTNIKPKKIILQPNHQTLEYTYKNNRVSFELKDFNCYQIVEII